jgi:hypothetical protein
MSAITRPWAPHPTIFIGRFVSDIMVNCLA